MISQVVTIAGSDSGGGAGIQADLKTFQELRVFGTSVITAVTAQNTTGVQGVYPMDVAAVREQLESIGSDFSIAAVKTGMLHNEEIIFSVSEAVKRFGWTQLVIDPVMIAKGGATLLQERAMEAMKSELLPLAAVITPNIPEAEVLTGRKITTMSDRLLAAHDLLEMGAKAVVLKGGHATDQHAADLLVTEEECYTFSSKRVETKNTHGTGCTFSAALTAELAKGKTIREAATVAKHFITQAIQKDLGIGSVHGPTNHWAYKESLLNEAIGGVTVEPLIHAKHM